MPSQSLYETEHWNSFPQQVCNTWVRWKHSTMLPPPCLVTLNLSTFRTNLFFSFKWPTFLPLLCFLSHAPCQKVSLHMGARFPVSHRKSSVLTYVSPKDNTKAF